MEYLNCFRSESFSSPLEDVSGAWALAPVDSEWCSGAS